MKIYFALQYKRINRIFRDAQIIPAVGYVLLAVIFTGLSSLLFHKTIYAPYLYLLLVAAVIIRQGDVRKTEFLILTFGDKQARKIRLAESMLTALPFSLFLCFQRLYLFAGSIIATAALLSLLRIHISYNIVIPTPFKKRPFEFIIGFRNTFWAIIAAYILIVIAICSNNYNIGIFSLGIIFAIITGYYLKPEDEMAVWNVRGTPKQFLLRKSLIACRYTAGLILIPAGTLMAAFPSFLWLTAAVVLLGYVFICYILLLKYAAFPKEINIVQAIISGLCLICPPMLIAMIPYFFKKAIQNLNHYLR